MSTLHTLCSYVQPFLPLQKTTDTAL